MCASATRCRFSEAGWPRPCAWSSRDDPHAMPPAQESALALRAPAPTPGLRHEDEDRSADRSRVFRARNGHRRWLLLWLLVGPGILAMLGENDGPSMISYATTGATYGLGTFLPFTLLTFAM